MKSSRWRSLLGPPSVVVSAAVMIAAAYPAIAAAPPKPAPITPPVACPPGSREIEAVLQPALGPGVGARIRDDVLLTGDGEESGRRLTVEPTDAQRVVISLPPESFVGQPREGLLLYGSHSEEGGSEVRAVHPASGCDVRLAQPDEIVRGATIDASGRYLFVHSVTHPDRRDGGVIRHDLQSGEQAQVVPRLPDSAYFGPTFGTLLAWSAEGDDLAVQSCGFSHCRTRILDTENGRVETYAGSGHGALIGLTRDSLVTFAACHWEPCAVLAIARPSGAVTELIEEAYGASLSLDNGSPLVQLQTAAGTLEVTP
jgi:hypothetical protein